MVGRAGSWIALAPVVATLASCGGAPAPTQHLADAVAATHVAQAGGAELVPQAALHLKLAQEAVLLAKRLMDDGDNRRASFVLLRAKGDADLALAEANESTAEAQANLAEQKVEALRAALPSGNGPTSTTTITSGTAPWSPPANAPPTPMPASSPSSPPTTGGF